MSSSSAIGPILIFRPELGSVEQRYRVGCEPRIDADQGVVENPLAIGEIVIVAPLPLAIPCPEMALEDGLLLEPLPAGSIGIALWRVRPAPEVFPPVALVDHEPVVGRDAGLMGGEFDDRREPVLGKYLVEGLAIFQARGINRLLESEVGDLPIPQHILEPAIEFFEIAALVLPPGGKWEKASARGLFPFEPVRPCRRGHR